MVIRERTWTKVENRKRRHLRTEEFCGDDVEDASRKEGGLPSVGYKHSSRGCSAGSGVSLESPGTCPHEGHLALSECS